MKIIPYKPTIYNNKTFIFHTEIIGLDFDEKNFDNIEKALPETNQIIVKFDEDSNLVVFDFDDGARTPKKIILDKKLKI